MTDTILVVGPPFAGAGAVASALRRRLAGCVVVEPADLMPGQIPDAVVFVTSAAAPMSDCDGAQLAAVAARSEVVVAAVAKIDVHRTWRSVLDVNRGQSPAGREVPWVGVAAHPQTGPVVIGALVDAVRAGLADEDRRRRQLLRARAAELQGRIAAREREAGRRAFLQARAARRSAVTMQVRRARLHLAGEARARSAALGAEVRREAAGASSRCRDTFENRVRHRAQQVADDFDRAVAERMAEVSIGAALAVPRLTPSPPVQSCVPSPHTAALEDRLAAVVGTGFGVSVALTAGRFLADAMPAAAPAVIALCGIAGLSLAGWMVRTRRLVTARAALERWAAEVASGVRAALDQRVLAAENALFEALAEGPVPADSTDRAMGDPVVEGWIGELARVRAELHDGVRG